jgi:Tol biopolymer transport system component
MGPISISSDKIVYYGNLSPSGIYTTDLDGNNPNLILAKPSNRYLESPCFSPDGNSIAYLSVDRDSTKLYHSVEVKIMNVDGSSPKSIIAVPAGGNTEFSNADQINNVTVCWSPDGKKLLFNVPEDNQVSHIYVVNVDGTGLTKITSLSGITDRKVTWSK